MATVERRNDRSAGILLLLVLLPAFSAAPIFAGDKQEKEPKSQTVFRVPVNIVVVNATVTDKDGNPVTDLSAKDFKVYDDGKLQDIQTFALEAYGPSAPAGIKESVIPAETADSKQNVPCRRIISIVLDDMTMESVVNFPRMIEAVKRYVERDMQPSDQVAILSGSGKV